MAKFFISYRREDTQYQADKFHQALGAHIDNPREDIFIDVDSIPFGVDFVEYLDAKVGQCQVLFVLIGSRWLEARDSETKKRRLDDPNDFVRIEIKSALTRGIPVVPVIFDNAKVPKPHELPDDLKPLSYKNGIQVNRLSFEADVERLIRGLPDMNDSVGASGKSPTKPVSPSDLRLTHSTSYWKQNQNGRDLYRIAIRLDASPEFLDRVEKVVYRLHSTFKNPVREVTDRSSRFELRTNGWGEFQLKAQVYLSDGSEPIDVTHMVTFDGR